MKLPVRPALIAFAATFLALPAGAQIYKSTLPGGRIVFGDTPDPKAIRVEELNPEPPTGPIDSGQAEGARQRLQQDAAAAEQRGKERRSKLDVIDKEIEAAQKDLRDAQRRLEEAEEPAAGERTGTTRKGKSQLNTDYSERQAGLQKDVQTQTERLERAQRQRDELTQ
jgi:hypothetical protein